MVPVDEPGRDIADDVLPEEVEDLAVPVALDALQPWHKPRKQFVRERQWIALARHLIEHERRQGRLARIDEPEIHYLTLPGIDYLDVRQLADACNDLGCRLTSTGFQSGKEGNPDVARAQLREKSLIDAGHITGDSHTFAKWFQEISRVGSEAYRELIRRGPFHIVNIDACGSVAAPREDHARRLIDAIFRMVELQLDAPVGRWLLFVTADVRPDSLAEDALDGLCRAIFENLGENGDFRGGASSLFGCDDADVEAAIEVASGNEGLAFLKVFSLGFAKWLLHLARGRQWEVLTHTPYCYSTRPQGDGTPTLACLAFEFRRRAGLRDPIGIVQAPPAPPGINQDTSVRAADKVAIMENVDRMMEAEPGVRAQMAERLKLLLREAGYHPAVLAAIEA